MMMMMMTDDDDDDDNDDDDNDDDVDTSHNNDVNFAFASSFDFPPFSFWISISWRSKIKVAYGGINGGDPAGP